MANFWKQLGVPHRGWFLIDVIDIRGEGQSEHETSYEECMMCGNEKIRYVHIVQHDDILEEFRVGCNCAEKMTEDYVNPRRRERDLRNRASRLTNWIDKQWKISQAGNPFLRLDRHFFLIFKDKYSGTFKYKLDENFCEKKFETIEDAKRASFKAMEKMKNRGDW